MSAPRVEDVLGLLRGAGLPVDHRDGERGVVAACPLCGARMAWAEGWAEFVCEAGCDGERVVATVAALATARVIVAYHGGAGR